MTRSQCYYEILGVSEAASADEIKKAYRSLALIWHPDKNQADPEEAHSKFQAILKAYETLSDSRERDWYDRHKDQILSDGKDDETVDSLNLFQYFSSSCYTNFDDSEDGFYTVYREVFEKIAQEEERAHQLVSKLSNKSRSKSVQEKPEYPTFGNSQSSYEDVVRHFYAFWSGFCTHFTFDSMDKYNTTEAENRRILKAMEKENRKIKEQARKERNTKIRNLVEFVKKRDRRLKQHKLLVDQRNELNRQKTAEKRRQQLEKSQQQSAAYKPTAWDNLDDIEEQLQQLENEYAEDSKKSRNKRSQNQARDQSEDEAEELNPEDKTASGGSSGELDNDNDDNHDEDEDEEEEEEEIEYLCPACNKNFRSVEAFKNHEGSKKHLQNVAKLTKLLKEEEKKLNK